MSKKRQKVHSQQQRVQQEETVLQSVKKAVTTVNDTECGRGVIRDNALKAVVTSVVFRTRVVKAKKGKGSFQRKDKYAGRESYSMAA
ncbi:ribosome alternative rescue factor ArfA [Photobacterium japonica]|uniref:alternative ribosome-rescue factor A n=1 Tax=Photobacterium japonica TaxID=2910235 RepID=UPI003D0F5953